MSDKGMADLNLEREKERVGRGGKEKIEDLRKLCRQQLKVTLRDTFE